MPLTPGTALGPYEILAPLGAGGMGEVYRARDTRLGREVAVKVLPAELASAPDALGRFEREARAVAALNHPNILALHDVGTAGGVTYAVTELLEGSTLRAKLAAEGALPPRKALELAVQIADGLAAAHARGLVHRDLKPENLFVTHDGRGKVLDFGIAVHDASHPAAVTAETMARTDASVVLGTAGYMAPEQVRGEAATGQTDLFALGIVIYEMLTGANPFVRETRPETMTAVLREQPPPVASSVSGVPPALARLIERCLEKRREDRPESTRDVAIFLEALLVDSAFSTARPGPAAARVPVDTGRLRVRMLGLTGGLVLGLTLAAWTYAGVVANRAVDAALAADLARARGLVSRAHDERLARMQLTAALVSSFPELKALLETDAATVRDFLLTYQQRNPGTPLLAAFDAEGRTLARTDTAAPGAPDRSPTWLARLFEARAAANVIVIDDRPFHAAAAAAEAGGTIFGYVVAAAPIDGEFARTLRDVTRDEAVVLDARGVLGSTLREDQLPWNSLETWRSAGGGSEVPLDLTIGALRFAALEVPLVEGGGLAAVVLTSRDEAIGPYRRIQTGLLVLGVLAVVAAALGSAWLARPAVAPRP